MLIGSVGGDGSNSHVDDMLSIVEEIAEAKWYSFKIAAIKEAIERTWIEQRILDGRLSSCDPVSSLEARDVHNAVEIVAQMRAEP